VVKDVLRAERTTLLGRSFGGVNPDRGFVDFRPSARDNHPMANARRILKAKKSSHRGIGISLAP
jgi:hypothetical protein